MLLRRRFAFCEGGSGVLFYVNRQVDRGGRGMPEREEVGDRSMD